MCKKVSYLCGGLCSPVPHAHSGNQSYQNQHMARCSRHHQLASVIQIPRFHSVYFVGRFKVLVSKFHVCSFRQSQRLERLCYTHAANLLSDYFLLSTYFLTVSCDKRMPLATRKFGWSTEVLPLDQTSQLSLTLEIKLPQFIEGVMTHVLQSSYWQPVKCPFQSKCLILDFYTWFVAAKSVNITEGKHLSTLQAYQILRMLSYVCQLPKCTPVARHARLRSNEMY